MDLLKKEKIVERRDGLGPEKGKKIYKKDGFAIEMGRDHGIKGVSWKIVIRFILPPPVPRNTLLPPSTHLFTLSLTRSNWLLFWWRDMFLIANVCEYICEEGRDVLMRPWSLEGVGLQLSMLCTTRLNWYIQGLGETLCVSRRCDSTVWFVAESVDAIRYGVLERPTFVYLGTTVLCSCYVPILGQHV